MSAQVTYCGPHYELAWNSSGADGTANGDDCQKQAFSTDISAYVHPGDTVDVQMILPPNPCGS